MTMISEWGSKTKTLLRKGRGFLSVSGGKYVDTILGGVLWLLLVRFLSQGEYGVITYWRSFAFMLSVISTLGFHQSFQTLIPKRKTQITSEGNFLTLFPSVGFALVLAYSTTLNPIIVGCYLFFLNRYLLAVKEILGEQNYLEFLCVAFGKRLVQIIFSLFFYQLFDLNGVFIGLTFGVAVTSYRSFLSLFSFPKNFRFPLTRDHLSFILYNFGRMSLIAIVGQIDRIIIGTIYGKSILGVYAFVAQIFSFFRMTSRGFSGYLVPEKSAGKDARIAELAGIGLSICMSILTFIFVPLGIRRVFPNFIEAINAVYVLSILPILMMASTILTSHFLSEEEGRTPFLSTIFSNFVRLVGVLTLYQVFGYLGLGAGLVLASFVTFFFLWVKKRMK